MSTISLTCSIVQALGTLVTIGLMVTDRLNKKKMIAFSPGTSDRISLFW